MNYKEAYAWGVELLEKACVEESKIDAWYLLEYVTKISRAVFYAYPERGRQGSQLRPAPL